MVIKENSPKQPFPRTILRTHVGALQSSERSGTKPHPLYILDIYPLYIHLRMFKMNNTHGTSKSNLKEKKHVAM